MEPWKTRITKVFPQSKGKHITVRNPKKVSATSNPLLCASWVPFCFSLGLGNLGIGEERGVKRASELELLLGLMEGVQVGGGTRFRGVARSLPWGGGWFARSSSKGPK